MKKNISLICLLSITLSSHHCCARSSAPCIPSWGQWQFETTPGLSIEFSPPGDQSGTVNVSACAPRFTNAFTSLQEFNCGESPSDSIIFDSNSVSVIWTASGCGASPAAGTGTNAVFTVSSAGSCTVEFTVDASTISDPYWGEIGLPAMPSWEFSSTAAQTFNVNPLPIAWQLQYFGQTGLNPMNLDASGNTLLFDYQNGLQPNLIEFSIETTNNVSSAKTMGRILRFREPS